MICGIHLLWMKKRTGKILLMVNCQNQPSLESLFSKKATVTLHQPSYHVRRQRDSHFPKLIFLTLLIIRK
uniref:Uncharacterized protein n=1 Tax=Medicago truncatula TaxID=3880 RepID=I3SEU2_MEDTR|nr:unknown [Medicago truncatula]